ncbi:XkdQ/YqbQ family protein [Acidaminococcus intestini]|uniref:XkdQ/YqbQ family protein n=1 Tax=Acidaminococcus intestini TaxID=187327 RepID=UPI003AB88CF5
MTEVTKLTGGDGLTVVINHKRTGEYFVPAVLDGLEWEIHRKGAAGKIDFKVVIDDALKMDHGDVVAVQWNGKQFFHGFIFKKARNMERIWTVRAYDQMRYLLNKDSFSYENKTAAEVIKELAEDFGVVCSEMPDTGYVIPKRREDGSTILDMAQNALDLTMIHTKKMYVMYDECGELKLANVESMQTDLFIDAETAGNIEYSSSIDKDVFNLIKLSVDDGNGGHRMVYAPMSNKNFEESETRKQWGVLQYYESVNPKNGQNPQEMADKLLEHYNHIRRTLKVRKQAGDLRIRAGSMLYVNIPTEDSDLKEETGKAHIAIVESVVHRFENNTHTMDLDLKGDWLNE